MPVPHQHLWVWRSSKGSGTVYSVGNTRINQDQVKVRALGRYVWPRAASPCVIRTMTGWDAALGLASVNYG